MYLMLIARFIINKLARPGVTWKFIFDAYARGPPRNFMRAMKIKFCASPEYKCASLRHLRSMIPKGLRADYVCIALNL